MTELVANETLCHDFKDKSSRSSFHIEGKTYIVTDDNHYQVTIEARPPALSSKVDKALRFQIWYRRDEKGDIVMDGLMRVSQYQQEKCINDLKDKSLAEFCVCKAGTTFGCKSNC